MEKRKRRIKIIEGLVNSLKNIGFYLKLIFWVIIIILSLFMALLFIPEKNPDYKSDDDLIREWMKNKDCE